MTEGELLARLARTLKGEIGPAVADEYARTQAFMAAVVLDKLGRQVALADAHAAARRAEGAALLADLQRLAGASPLPPAVTQALETLREDLDAGALASLVEVLYAEREALGAQRFEALLGRVRETLRADLDRRLAIAK